MIQIYYTTCGVYTMHIHVHTYDRGRLGVVVEAKQGKPSVLQKIRGNEKKNRQRIQDMPHREEINLCILQY